MVMERSKLEFVMPTPPQQAPKLDDGGSGGGDGKHNHNGGGGGDDGGDDDDYFGGEGDGEGDGQGGGGGGDGFFRTALPELYDRLTIAAVLQEWYKTVVELPLFIRRAVEMGLFSSAQLVRFLSMDVRPGVARSVSRTLPSEVRGAAGHFALGCWGGAAGRACHGGLARTEAAVMMVCWIVPVVLAPLVGLAWPCRRDATSALCVSCHISTGFAAQTGSLQQLGSWPAKQQPVPCCMFPHVLTLSAVSLAWPVLLLLCLQWARGFVGRLMADPAFIQKLVFEQLMTFSASMVYEWRVRGDNFKQVGAGACFGSGMV
jgi:hypothetical protein